MKRYARRYLKISSLGIFIFILLLCLSGCRNAEKKIVRKNLPRNLKEAISYLNNDWNFLEKIKFKNQPEDEAVTSLHFSTGLWIRNNWIYGDRDTSLVNYFHRIGIYAPDDISSIIVTSFHRQLNHKPLDIDGQVKPIKAYWKAISDCEANTMKIALLNYKKYTAGSPITILMAVDTSDKQRNATVYECLNVDWKFNPQKDLMINGIVTGKYFRGDSSNVFFKVRIDKMNYPNTAIFSDAVKIGHVVDFSLDHLTITRPK